ncbi:MAG: hypothetical protein GX663_06360 [Clostridiales bacterium]|nr:hypothetical protein [Clostridiales bacterium]
MSFSLFNCSEMTAEEIKERISQYTKDTILIYCVFNEDGEGTRYTLTEGVQMITSAANVPVFKADEAGVSNGTKALYLPEL